MNSDISDLGGALCFLLLALKLMFDYLKTRKNGNGKNGLSEAIKELNMKLDKVLEKLGETNTKQELHTAKMNGVPEAIKDVAMCLVQISAHLESTVKAIERIENRKVTAG
jgi:hypothetical protein